MIRGVAHAPRLIHPNPIPNDFLRQCKSYAAVAKEIEPQQSAALKRFLDDPLPIPARIREVSPAVGHGLFANRELQPGEIIGEYTGQLSDDWKLLRDGGEFNPYLLRYPFETRYAIDARRHGNETRFINHSSKNANAGRRHVFHGGIIQVVFVVERKIAKGEQILIDYGPDYWQSSAPVEL